MDEKRMQSRGLRVTAGLALLATAPRTAAQQTSAVPPPSVASGGAAFGQTPKVVAVLPYSAEEIVETTQTLPDGNRINGTGTAWVYRDSGGRTRREVPLIAPGPPGTPGYSPTKEIGRASCRERV